MARKTRQVETRLVAEYLMSSYSSYTYLTKVPLGVVPESLQADVGYNKALGVMRPFRPEVDAVVVLPNYLVIIEAKVWSVVNGLGKIPLYKTLVPLTPELKQYMPRDIIMELVVGWSYANLEHMAEAAGVRVKVFCPAWLQEVVDSMHKYWTPEYIAERNRKLSLREYFGIE